MPSMRTSLLAIGSEIGPSPPPPVPLRTGGCPSRGLPSPAGPAGRSARSCARGRRRPRRHPPRRAPPRFSTPVGGAMFLPELKRGWCMWRGAPRPVVGGEVLFEPPRLGRTRAAANLLELLLRATTCRTRARRSSSPPRGRLLRLTEVLEVASGPFGEVLVVTGTGLVRSLNRPHVARSIPRSSPPSLGGTPHRPGPGPSRRCPRPARR